VAVLHVVLAGWLVSRVYRKAVRSGLLARYSAESVS
jgi:ABC-2 type transport system permease protein